MIRLANAPCSWGVLEFDLPGARASPSQMLDEMAATGYAGTELGDWGFLPTEPAALAGALAHRKLTMVGAFVPIALSDRAAIDEGATRAVRTATLLAALTPKAVVVLSDDNGTVAARTSRAGRITPEDSLTAEEWDRFAQRAELIAHAVRNASGLRTVFHHHCAGYVETPLEIEALMSRTDPTVLGLCLDTGHLTYGGGDPTEAVRRYGSRIWHVHFKDCDPAVAGQARAAGWDYHTAVGHGVFCELGRGSVDFGTIRNALQIWNYSGWIVVEQDLLPGRGTPAESARRNREYLRTLGI